MLKRKTLAFCICVFITAMFLSSCKIADQVAEKIDPNLQVLEHTAVVTSAEELNQLDVYANLQKLDVRGSDCYDAILAYIQAHPQVEVLYDVELGGRRWSQDTGEMELADGTYTLEELLTGISYLPQMNALSLPCTTLTRDDMDLLNQCLPAIQISYTVQLLGQELTISNTAVDLSSALPKELDTVLAQLQLLPALEEIELMKADGSSSMSLTDVKRIMDAVPGAFVNYSFDLFGNRISTADERVEYLNVPIGNEGIPQIRQALDILPNCTYFLMDTCGVDDHIMAQLREDYADRTKVVWRIWLVEENYNSKLFMRCGSYLTDTHRVRTTYVNDENSHLLNYCTETKYLDVGHVWQLNQCEFLAYMPDLEVCIIAITEITDITPLANHEKLEYLELFTTDIADISPLITCPNIEHLNLSNMPKLDDITPVLSLTKLKRLRMVDSPLISDAEKQQIAEALPECNILNMGHFATSWGWRWLDPYKENPDPRYALLCEQMEYEIDAYEYGIP